MSKISLKHSGGNVVSLNSPTSAPTSADVAFKLPNQDGSANEVLKTDGSGNLAFATVVDTKGVEMADQWRITSGGTLTTDSTTIFSANWERADTYATGQIGSGMTESSGVFTFPSTGIYRIVGMMPFDRVSGETRYAFLQIQLTTDNSSYNVIATGSGSFASAYSRNTACVQYHLDVTDTSTHKLKFSAYTNRSSVRFHGNTDNQENSFTFIKLGET